MIETQPYSTPLFVARVGIVREDRLFYFQRSAGAKKGAGLWEWAGGQLDREDYPSNLQPTQEQLLTAIGRAAARETYEETGLSVRFRGAAREIGRRMMHGGTYEGREHVVYATLATTQDTYPKINEQEHQDYALLSYSEAVELAEAGLMTAETAKAQETLLPAIIRTAIFSDKSHKNTIYSAA